MFLILCSLFEIGAEIYMNFIIKVREKNKNQMKFTKNVILRLAAFTVFSLIFRSTNRKNGREYLETWMYSNQSSWTALILRYSEWGDVTAKPSAIIFSFLGRIKEVFENEKNHPSPQNEKRMTLGFQAGHFKLCFLSLEIY